MAAKVKILIEGTTVADSVADNGTEHTRPTVTLVRDGETIMVVDPGVLESQQVLVDALTKEGLTVNDVNVVCITHSHLDHYRNIGMFSHAKALDYFGLWDKTTIVNWSEYLTENIRVLHTPGHDYTGITLFVTTAEGVIAICGDVFWKENYPQDPYEDAYASNPERLKESRDTVLKLADFIVPGHAGMYKNEKIDILAEGKTPRKAKILKNNEINVACKKCGRPMKQKDKCWCRPYLCYRCCECGLDCDLCHCSHFNG